ncbi:MAG: hypothetical protein ACRDS1_05665 [Pseudonocardiaceae bacterium]
MRSELQPQLPAQLQSALPADLLAAVQPDVRPDQLQAQPMLAALLTGPHVA